jgi:predicted  nucleic acid-binding Zn-ribbon protein
MEAVFGDLDEIEKKVEKSLEDMAFITDAVRQLQQERTELAEKCVKLKDNLDNALMQLNTARDRNAELAECLKKVRTGSLMAIRRAAFAPEIGVRYSEAIRADISNECWLLERDIDKVLGDPPTPYPQLGLGSGS